MEPHIRFSGKVVIVTGAGSGIGEASAVQYGAEGARVLAADVDEGSAGITAETIRTAGGEATPFQVDLSGRAPSHAMVEAAVKIYGRLDILANIAAIYPSALVEEVTEENWDRLMAVDLKGPFFACQAALTQMKSQGSGGVIVNIASGAAFHPLQGHSAYSAAKGGIVSMTRVIALEAAPYGIRVNTVVPGGTDTPGNRVELGFTPDTSLELPLNERYMRPDEIANVILWCSSGAAHMVNGALLRVDGGRRML